MILILHRMPPFEEKVNFIDSNNLLLGFDLEEQCCEHWEWEICRIDGDSILKVDQKSQPFAKNLDGYVFDPEYYVCNNKVDPEEIGERPYAATFRLVAEQFRDLPPLFLTLFNEHNGYYDHGFDFSKPFISDSL